MNEIVRNELLKLIDILCDMVNTVVYDKCTYDEYSNICDIIGNIETLIEDEPIYTNHNIMFELMEKLVQENKNGEEE